MRPYWLARDEGDAIWMFDSMDVIKADASDTRGSFSLVEFMDSMGSTVPLHVNDGWDRGFYVLSGEYATVVETTPSRRHPGHGSGQVRPAWTGYIKVILEPAASPSTQPGCGLQSVSREPTRGQE